MTNVITKYDHYLFLDFEMTMQVIMLEKNLLQKSFNLAPFNDNKGNVILERNYYVLPKTEDLQLDD